MSTEFRAYLKPKGANPEIDSCYYELASHQRIYGMWNCEVLSLGFVCGTPVSQMLFRPIDPKKPIVFAVGGRMDGTYFIVVDAHTPGKKHNRMVNFKPHKTDRFIILCDDGAGLMSEARPRDFWGIKAQGETYVFGRSFPDTWQLTSVEPLCAFVGGGLTANQLRAEAYRHKREDTKEVRRQHRIKLLVFQAEGLLEHIDAQDRRVGKLEDEKHLMEILIKKVRESVNGSWLPGMLRSKLLKLLEQFDTAVEKSKQA